MLGDNYPFIKDEWGKDKKEHYTPEDIVKIDTYKHIKNAIKRYGLEGTEEVIKRIYSHNSKARDYMLKTLYEIWKG